MFNNKNNYFISIIEINNEGLKGHSDIPVSKEIFFNYINKISELYEINKIEINNRLLVYSIKIENKIFQLGYIINECKLTED